MQLRGNSRLEFDKYFKFKVAIGYKKITEFDNCPRFEVNSLYHGIHNPQPSSIYDAHVF